MVQVSIVAVVGGGGVMDAQLPGPVGRLGGQVHGVGLVDVVGAAAGPVVQDVGAAVRRDEVDDQVTA